MTAKAGPGCDLSSFQTNESAERTVRRVAVSRNDEMVACLQPSVIAMVERVLGSKLQHDHPSIVGHGGVRFGLVMALKRSPD